MLLNESINIKQSIYFYVTFQLKYLSLKHYIEKAYFYNEYLFQKSFNSLTIEQWASSHVYLACNSSVKCPHVCGLYFWTTIAASISKISKFH